MNVFSTDRLVVRPWALSDQEAIWTIYSNPEVTHFIPDLHLNKREELNPRMERLLSLSYPPGFGVWAIQKKSGEDILGTVLLKPLPDGENIPTSDIEVGWHLDQSYWGLGFATEVGRGALRYGFEHLGLGEIYAVANEKNTSSLAVMKRLGMEILGLTNRYYGQESFCAVARKNSLGG